MANYDIGMIRRHIQRCVCFALCASLLLFFTRRNSEHSSSRSQITVSNTSHPCKEWFNESFEDNLNVIANYPRRHTDELMRQLFGSATKPVTMETFPVILTAANTKYYHPSQGLLRNIDEVLRPKYPSLRVVYYDIGLLPEEHAQLKKHCRCDVRSFPFDKTPEHVRIGKSYTWKPIVVKLALMEFGFVWWLDTSMRFKTADVEIALDYAKANGFLIFSHLNSVAYHTDLQTMAYLGEDSCKFREFGETQSGNCLFLSTRVTDIVVNAWAACALDADCMYPPGTDGKKSCTINCGRKKGITDGCCHRYDQSVLSIFHRRLNHSTDFFPPKDDPIRDIYFIRRHEMAYYFPNDTALSDG